MRDIFFIVADGQAAATVTAFLTRPRFHESLGTAPFDFDPDEDLLDLPNNDPGVFNEAPSLSRNYLGTHRKLVVMLDEAWDTKKTPTADQMRTDLRRRLLTSGWDKDNFTVIVIAPELENWIWQNNPHLARVFGFDQFLGFIDVKTLLEAEGVWNAATGKPMQPKETLERLCRRARTRPDRRRYAQIAELVNVSRCRDGAFQELCATLRQWFPIVEDASSVTTEETGTSG